VANVTQLDFGLPPVLRRFSPAASAPSHIAKTEIVLSQSP